MWVGPVHAHKCKASMQDKRCICQKVQGRQSAGHARHGVKRGLQKSTHEEPSVEQLLQIADHAHIDERGHVICFALAEFLAVNPAAGQHAPLCVLRERPRHHHLRNNTLRSLWTNLWLPSADGASEQPPNNTKKI